MRNVVASVIALSIAFAACSDSTEPTHRSPGTKAFSRLPGTSYSNFDDKLAEIASVFPGFGGVYVDAGVLMINSADPALDVREVQAFVADVFGERLRAMPAQRVAATYSFLDLYNWSQHLPRAYQLPGVRTVDINEKLNRLVVGVASIGLEPAVRELLQGYGVPSDAIVVKTVGPTRPVATLDDMSRPVAGGARVRYVRAGSTFSCTMGFNGRWNNKNVYASNGHCGIINGTADTSAFYQPTVSSTNFMGREVFEGHLFSSSEDSRCPVTTAQCKHHELKLGEYSNSNNIAGAHATVFRTSFRSTVMGNGGTTVDGTLTINDELLWPLMGEVVDKIGITTGWTSGQVTSTCETSPMSAQANVWYITCAYVAAAYVDEGDSGSAVFFYTSGSNDIQLVGQLFARRDIDLNGVPEGFVFSTMNAIQADAGEIFTSTKPTT